MIPLGRLTGCWFRLANALVTGEKNRRRARARRSDRRARRVRNEISDSKMDEAILRAGAADARLEITFSNWEMNKRRRAKAAESRRRLRKSWRHTGAPSSIFTRSRSLCYNQRYTWLSGSLGVANSTSAKWRSSSRKRRPGRTARRLSRANHKRPRQKGKRNGSARPRGSSVSRRATGKREQPGSPVARVAPVPCRLLCDGSRACDRVIRRTKRRRTTSCLPKRN